MMPDIGMAGRTILVTGGTGFIGRVLCTALQARGAKVIILSRQGRATHCNLSVRRLEEIPGDMAIDIVINLAGETIAQRWGAGAKQRIRESRIQLTTELVNFMLSRPVLPRVFISGSAIGYYGTSETVSFDEAMAPLSHPSSYAQSLCHDWETEALQAEVAGIRTIYLRMGAVLDNEGGMIKKMHPAFALGLGGPMGSGSQWLSWIHRRDLVALILFLIGNDYIAGAVNATAPQAVTNEQFSKAFGRALRRPAFFTMPAFVVRLIFGQMGDEIMLSGQKVVPRKALEHGFEFQYADIHAALVDIAHKA